VLGTGINPLTMQEAVDWIESAIQARTHGYVCVAAAHSVMACWRDDSLRRIFNLSMMTTPDGMSLVWLARAAVRRPVQRVYGPDLMMAVCNRFLSRGYQHFFYGSGLGVANELAARMMNQFPGLRVAGTFSPPFRTLTPAEDAEVVDRIDSSGADLVWVGLGTGKQERWMAEHLGKIRAPMMIGVGAAFDLLSGQKPQAPRWMQRSGFEWLFRLASEPRRLWGRYAEYPWFVVLLLAQLTRLKKFDMED
jgi:N-acetylglucosaminyldiphosphoundecaprenol N-acetyl-beta-D-mannosaminyltransferase